MQTFYQILGLIGSGVIIWFLYQGIKGRPELFSKDNLTKSFSTMGLLGLALIAFVTVLVFILRG